MLSVHQGNRLECLADRLIDSLAKADDAPLEARLVVVPSSAMARWLKLRIASRLGICTQVDFPYPAELIWRLFASVLPGIGQDSPFDREIMTWRLHGLLGRLPARDEFAALDGDHRALSFRARLSRGGGDLLARALGGALISASAPIARAAA